MLEKETIISTILYLLFFGLPIFSLMVCDGNPFHSNEAGPCMPDFQIIEQIAFVFNYFLLISLGTLGIPIIVYIRAIVSLIRGIRKQLEER